jgi:signal transduction histidine kinase
MRERVALVGGRFEAIGRSGLGTTLSAHIPVPGRLT